MRLLDRFRLFCSNYGYTCDCCGREIFNYPKERLCEQCNELLYWNRGLVCEKCGRKSVAIGACLSCKKTLPIFSKGGSTLVYQDDAAELVKRFKNGKRYLAGLFSEKMANTLYERFSNPQEFLIVYVPITKEREKIRGFNQARELAFFLSVKTSIEMEEDVLVKTRDEAQQKYLNRKERKENVEGVFRVHKRKIVRGRRILLIDDIMTTGATASECARVLKNAGAKEVCLLTVAAIPELK